MYLFEFKVVEEVAEGKALPQLQARGYAEKYREPGRDHHPGGHRVQPGSAQRGGL
jgi:hypothetical protein